MILQDISCAIDLQQRRAEVVFEASWNSREVYFQRVFDQSRRHLTKIPKYREVTAAARDR